MPANLVLGAVTQRAGAEFFEAPVKVSDNWIMETRETYTITTDEVIDQEAQQSIDYGPDSHLIYYDEDGNIEAELTHASRSYATRQANPENRIPEIEYKFDAENRLIEIKKVSNPGRFRKTFTYDYLGRRVGEKYYDGYSLNTFRYERRYIYDGMQMIAEYSVSGSTLSRVKSYYWGLDITDTPGGAGGIGGLILIDDAASGKSYFPGYDGRGNLTLLLDTADVSLDAVFEYSPYGRTWRASGPAADLTPFRYQTKWSLDHGPKKGEHWTIDQYDYGLRIYDAQMGRFISRDPLGEAGGMNLYAAFGNDPVNKWDYLGLHTPAYYEEEKRKQEELERANCVALPDHYWIDGKCVYRQELEPYPIGGTGLGPLSQAGWMNLWGGDRGYNPNAGSGNGGTGSPHNGPNGNGGGGGPNKALQDCLDAALAAFESDMNRIDELMNDTIMSEFEELEANRTAARAQFGASVAQMVSDTAYSTAAGLATGGLSSFTYVNRARQARKLYSLTRSFASVRRAARVASAAQLRANYLMTGVGFAGSVTYQFAVVETPGALGVGISTGIVDELGNTKGVFGVVVGLTLSAHEAYVSSGASPEEAAAIVAHQLGIRDRLGNTVSGRYGEAVSNCHGK